MTLNTLTKDELAQLLKEAQSAHAQYELALGAKDDHWATWYAEFILNRLQTLTTKPLWDAADDDKDTGMADKKPAFPAAENPVPASPNLRTHPLPMAPGPQQICPACGHRNRVGVLVCEDCGTNLTTGQRTDLGTRDLREPESLDDVQSAAEQMVRLGEREAKAVSTAGTNTFNRSMSLRIEVEGGSKPIVLKPRNEDMIFGRRDPTTGSAPEVDLTPFAGYRMGVSRRHASLQMEAERLSLWDLGSSNGTFLNGNKLNPHQPYGLSDGDEVRLGQMVLKVYFQSDS
jgi:hypothetical protein